MNTIPPIPIPVQPNNIKPYQPVISKKTAFSKQQILILTGILISFFTVITAIYLVGNRIMSSGKAKETQTGAVLSKENSYIFASPISAFADGISIVRITVILLNSQGLGIGGQTVVLKISGPLTVAQIKPMTDEYGRAIFDATSNTPGNYTISAEIGGVSLSQAVSVSFQ